MRLCASSIYLLAALLAVLVGLGNNAQATPSEPASFRLADASQQGTFQIGEAQAVLTRTSDPATGSDGFALDYTLPPGSAAGLWAKGLPATLTANNADVVRARARLDESGQTGLVAVALEIKGTDGVQRIPLELRPGWNHLETTLDWPAIGQFNEAVVAISRIGDSATAAGTLSVDIEFGRRPLFQKLAAMPLARIAMVLLVGLVAAGLSAVPRRLVAVNGETRAVVHEAAGDTSWLGNLKRDFVLGTSAVCIAGITLAIYHLGGQGNVDVWVAVVVAAAGAVLGQWMKYGLTGRHLTSSEIFQNTAASGLLAASASPLAILQAPGGWSDLLLLSSLVAAVAALLYHAANLYQLATSVKHLSPVAGALIVGTPYVFGSLVSLASTGLLESLGGGLTAGLLAGWPAALKALGAVFVVFAFNEAVANGIAMAAGRRPIRALPTHLWLLAAAAAVVAAPWIADLGSSQRVASLPAPLLWVATILATVLSQAGLWAEVYLITGMVLDAIRGRGPSPKAAAAHPVEGVKKGMIFSGVFMGILYSIGLLASVPGAAAAIAEHPLIVATLLGALAFPLAKTIIETFDGSQRFARRAAKSYRDPILYARGAVVGLGLGYAFSQGLPHVATLGRVEFAAGVGIAAFAGVSLLRDAIRSYYGRGRVQSWRVYFTHAVLGGLIGAGLGFYLDASQVSVVVAKFHRYLGAGQSPETFGVYPLLSKWGYLNLGDVTGGVKLLFAESLAGVISWSIPAWLFALNRTFMSAYFRREMAPIAALFTKEGFLQLVRNMIEVLRWGLWMSPIIASFLRPVGDPTWYNQDGAIRTAIAIFQNATLSPEAFRAWSLGVFIYLLAYDGVRILIWLDHMGLRVATLVNLSFLGMDKLDRRLARFLGPAATAQCIPESVKRFATWAPLLIPFYIPRGSEWDYAWSKSESLQAAAGDGLVAGLMAMPLPQTVILAAVAIAAATFGFAVIRWIHSRSASRRARVWTLAGAQYEVVLKENGEMFSRVPAKNYDVSRRSYDQLDPAGRALFLVDPSAEADDPARAWPLVGNFPRRRSSIPQIEQSADALRIADSSHGVHATVDIELAGDGDPAEVWTVTLENLTDRERRLKLATYLEWVLNRPDADRGHTQYNRLFPEMEYVEDLNAVLAWHKQSKAMGVLAADVAPEGFLTSRVDFIGRARSLADPRALETLAFSAARDTGAHPTFDPIGSLLVDVCLKPKAAVQVRLLIGLAKDKEQAIQLIARRLEIPGAEQVSAVRKREAHRPVGHGEIPPAVPQPYSEFSDDGRKLLVHTPFTPRPYDHTMSNAKGHVMVVTNRGLHTSSSVNSQQNRLTPDCPDIVTREVPGEAFYLYDLEGGQWYSPTYQPLNDPQAFHEVEFGVDGTAVYRMQRDTLTTELTAFVPPDEPAGIYLLSVRNHGETTRRLRLASYFQMVLADQPEHSGPLKIRRDRQQGAVYFENPRNVYRTGPAFVGMSPAAEQVETDRGRFFGGEDVAHPLLVERGTADFEPADDTQPVAALLTTLEIPAGGEQTVAVVLGQADDRGQAESILRKYCHPASARAALARTRSWWLDLIDTVRVETDAPDVDRYLHWLKYQTLAERIWARRGFYQASGAYGFRDQLQDSVNLIWVDPVLARRQILLHASQQFVEGDVVHWFHRLQDGRTGFSGRTYASDNLLWLAWAVVEYVGAVGDETLLDEPAAYLEAEQLLPPLPAGKHGMGFDPLRSSRTDSVYRHCMRAIDLVLEKRMGAHGLPLILTGDWNDGLDEIGSEGKGESVWLGFFLYYILQRMAPIIERRDGFVRKEHYLRQSERLRDALQNTWRGDRYLRAIHDDGTEIGVAGSGVWEIDALTAAWAVMSGIDPSRGRIVFETALQVLETDHTILLGAPPLREDTKPYLGRSSWYPEGVRENGMYCHGVQWLVGAARLLAEQCRRDGELEAARHYAQTALRLWRKISPMEHVVPSQIETYGGQPNKQAADLVTASDPGRMGWHGYTGAAGWLFRQALEGVLGMRLEHNRPIAPADAEGLGPLGTACVYREVARSPLEGSAGDSPQGPAPTLPLRSHFESKQHAERVEVQG